MISYTSNKKDKISMFYREIKTDIKVGLTIPQFTVDLFALTDQNRDYLKVWLPWLDGIKKPDDTKKYIELQLQRFCKGEALHQTIFYKNEIAGVVGFNLLDQANGIGHIGYWLGEEYTGKDIMTLAVNDLIHLGFENWSIQKMDIRCAVGNTRSRAIPERLGFRNEGTIRNAERVYEKYNDHIVYGLLKEEYICK